MLARRMTMLVLALLAVTAGCRALGTDRDQDRDKAKNGGGGSMYRESGGTGSR